MADSSAVGVEPAGSATTELVIIYRNYGNNILKQAVLESKARIKQCNLISQRKAHPTFYSFVNL